VHVIGLSVELGQLAPEVRAVIPQDLLHTVQVRCGEHLVPVLGDENHVRMQDEAQCLPARCHYRQ